MVLGRERAVEVLCWVLPGAAAAAGWGWKVGLLTFASQMFAAPAVSKIYMLRRVREVEPSPEEVERSRLALHLIVGSLLSFLARWAVLG